MKNSVSQTVSLFLSLFLGLCLNSLSAQDSVYFSHGGGNADPEQRYTKLVVEEGTFLAFEVYSPEDGSLVGVEVYSLIDRNLDISVLNRQGNKVLDMKETSVKEGINFVPFDKSKLRNGVYTVSIRDGSTRHNKKLIVH